MTRTKRIPLWMIGAHAITAGITSLVWLVALVGGAWINEIDWRETYVTARAIVAWPGNIHPLSTGRPDPIRGDTGWADPLFHTMGDQERGAWRLAPDLYQTQGDKLPNDSLYHRDQSRPSGPPCLQRRVFIRAR